MLSIFTDFSGWSKIAVEQIGGRAAQNNIELLRQ
jgi:hypothetical protein